MAKKVAATNERDSRNCIVTVQLQNDYGIFTNYCSLKSAYLYSGKDISCVEKILNFLSDDIIFKM